MFLSNSYQLYVVIEGPEEYRIYEKDLDKCMPFILNVQKNSKNSPLTSPRKPGRFAINSARS
jgi:hypothetical protein